MKEIVNQEDFGDMLLKERSVLSFNFDWSGPAVLGIQNLRATDLFFLKQKNIAEINFWFADMSSETNLKVFINKWLEKHLSNSNFGIIFNGYPLIIWLSFGKILNDEFRADLLKTDGIIKKTLKYFKL